MLGANRYGKAEIRLVRVVRDGGAPRADATSTSASRSAGDLDATHLTGDNAGVLPTDTQKNTVYAFARKHGVGEIEEFGLLLARHFVDTPAERSTGPGSTIERVPWQRLGPHSFAARRRRDPHGRR